MCAEEVPDIVPNFRLLNKKSRRIYRSSCIDYTTEDKLKLFDELGVETIIDMRAFSEYRRTRGRKLIDNFFTLYKVNVGWRERFRPSEKLTLTPVSSTTKEHDKLHYFISFFTACYIWNVFRRNVSLIVALYCFLYAVKDLVSGNWGFPCVVQYFSKFLNQEGLVGQYKNMVDYSKQSIYAALKIIAERGDRPLVVCCAFGKDRTSVVAAIVEACIGVPDLDIARSYSLNTELCMPLMEHMRRNLMHRYGLSEDFVMSKEETMLELLAYIRKMYGSVSDYLTHIGFGPMEQAQLRRHFGVTQ